MALVLGIDPGSRVTGYALVEDRGTDLVYRDSGCIRVDTRASIADRLVEIFKGLNTIIEAGRPEQAAIEEVFVSRNPGTSLKLGQARGAAMLAARLNGLTVDEYAARQVKQAVVGTGSARKEQVQHMVRLLLKLRSDPPQDAADALAIAVCHINTSRGMGKVLGKGPGRPSRGQAGAFSRGRFRMGSARG